jgi:hypothetical protein
MTKTKEELAEEARRKLNDYTGGWEETFDKGFLLGYEAGQPKWVSVEDALPKRRQLVFVKLKDGVVYDCSRHTEAYLDDEGHRDYMFWAHLGGETWDVTEVTHWLPISTLPTKEK